MILDFLEKLHEKRTGGEVWQLLLTQLNEFGFDRALYGYTRFRTPQSFGHREDILILSNHSDEYMKQFIDGGMYFDAPMVNWALDNVGARSWSMVQNNPEALSDRQREIVAFNKSMGIKAGYSISFKDISSRTKGAIGLVAKPEMTQQDVDDLWLDQGRTITQICNVAHLKMSNLPYASLHRTLTSRQREVLEWVGDGKTTQDIATIMGLTAATIEKHSRLARAALGVETTAQAVLKASYYNQIFVLSE